MISNQIKLFFHCGLCVSERLAPDIEAGYTEIGFQVWCRVHDCNIFHMDLEHTKHPANTSRQMTAKEKEKRLQ